MNEKSAVEAVAGSTTVTLAANAAPVLAQIFPDIGAMVGATAIPLLSAVPFLHRPSRRDASRLELKLVFRRSLRTRPGSNAT
jgi:hypothetical protein